MILRKEHQLKAMNMLEKLSRHESKLAVVGLGYVGLPLAAAFAEKFQVIGFDMNERKIAAYSQGHDVTAEIGDEALQKSGIDLTADPRRLGEASFIVIAVPTPINGDKTPDLDPVKGASETVGKFLQKGSIVVYESTVYPGVTEDICLPLLEEGSGLRAGRDFKVGYSPERINPGDRHHRLKSITKIVSGMDGESLALHHRAHLSCRLYQGGRGSQAGGKYPAGYQYRLHERAFHGLSPDGH